MSFTNSGDARIIEDQSPVIKNGELETKFTVGGNQTGVLIRATEASYGMVNYNSGKGWVIENATAWKDISGPELAVGDEVILRVSFVEAHLTINVSVNGAEFEKIFDEETDIIPIQAGKVGYRAWGTSKTTVYDYMKYSPMVVDKGPIVSIDEVNLETYPRVKPSLPGTITVNHETQMSSIKEVLWNYIPEENYSKPGEFTVEGRVEGTDIKAIANIVVTSDLDSYAINFDTEESRGAWELKNGSGDISFTDGKMVVPMNGVSKAVDMTSPDVKNFIYETDFSTSSDDGRIGLLFRYASETEWGAICYDNGSWIWKTGDDKYGAFPGSFKIEPNVNYKLKVKVEDTNVTLYINDEKIGQASITNLPNVEGKVGLLGWYGSKNITLDNLSVNEIGGLVAPEPGELLPEVIESDVMKVVLDNRFPTIMRYEWKGTDDILAGASVSDLYSQYIVEINGEKYIPTVTSEFKGNEAFYTLDFKDIGMTINMKMIVDGNKVRMEVTDVVEGDVKLQTLNFPNHSLASVDSLSGGKTASVLTTGDWNNINESFVDVKDIRPGVNGKTYAFINNDKFAVTVDNNTIEGGNRVVLTTENNILPDNTNFKQTGISNGTWTYREVLEAATGTGGKLYQGELPWSEIIIGRDGNEDGVVDWQDGAIEYRKNMKIPVGGDDIKNNLSRIDFNIGYTQNPFLRSLDTVKKLSNYTDNFGQLILHKGYQAEGHDDSHPDYGGHIGMRQGGKEDFNTLINEGKEYNAKIGVHINATEYMMDAFDYPEEIVNEGSPGWGWLDQAYYVDQRADLMTGGLFDRLDDLKADAPDLSWVYVDVYTGNGWNAHQLGEKINDLGYMLATEMNGPLEQHVPWTHWGGDPAYPNKGNESKIMRFMKNDTQDSFLADPLVKGNKHLLSGGWGTRHDIEGEFGTEVFYNQVLPTKYLQHFKIMKMTDNEVLFEDGVKSVREGANINYYKNDRLIATTPEASIGNTGIGDTLSFLPWNPINEKDAEKIYHWNPLGTTSEWTLPEGWDNNEKLYLYELSDLGRTFVKEVPVVDGKVTLEVETDTPYIVVKEKVDEERIDDWGEGAQIKDPGFDSQSFEEWEKESSIENEDHINVINEDVNRRKGNDVLRIDGNNEDEISQEIEDLKPGSTYSVSAWVKNDTGREVTLGVEVEDDEEDKDYTNVITSGGKIRQGEGVKFIDDTFVRMEVEFTVPEDEDEVDIYLKTDKGTEDSVVFVDDFRIWEHPGHTNKGGYVFYEDFENVDEGIAPFYLSPGRGHSNRTHLAEKDISIDANQKMDWVLDGRFSLKSNQQPGEVGEMLTTDGSSLNLEANKEYEFGFLYSLATEEAGYSVNIKDKAGNNIVNIPLLASGADYETGEYTKNKSITHRFTTGDLAGDYYITLDKGNGYKEVLLDNIYVKEVNKVVETVEVSNVNLNTVENNLVVGQSVPFNLNGLMNNGEFIDFTGAKIEYKVSNKEVLSVEDGMIVGLKDGVSDIQATVIVDGKKVSSNTVKVTVGKVIDEDDQEEIDDMKVEDLRVNGKPSKNSIKIKWDEPEEDDDIKRYIIYKDGEIVDEVRSFNRRYHFKKLESDTNYKLEVATKYKDGTISEKVSIDVKTK